MRASFEVRAYVSARLHTGQLVHSLPLLVGSASMPCIGLLQFSAVADHGPDGGADVVADDRAFDGQQEVDVAGGFGEGLVVSLAFPAILTFVTHTRSWVLQIQTQRCAMLHISLAVPLFLPLKLVNWHRWHLFRRF